MVFPLKSNEHALIESSTRYLGEDGILLLTDKRLVYFCVIKEYLKALEYEIIVDVPLEYITNASSRGYGLSILVVETDTKRISGNPKHEFFLIDAHKWVDIINRFSKKKGQSKPTQIRSKHISARPGPIADKRFSKLCLNCMGVVPEGVHICPKCGEYV